MNQVHREWKAQEVERMNHALAAKAEEILQTLREAENHLVRLHAGLEPRFSTTAMIQRLRIAIVDLSVPRRAPTLDEYMRVERDHAARDMALRDARLNDTRRAPRRPINDALEGLPYRKPSIGSRFWKAVRGV